VKIRNEGNKMSERNQDSKITGGCLCGAVRYEITGSLDEPTNLKTLGNIWLSQKGDYYSIDDKLPKYQKRWSDI
jgi:hypothetical protein